MCESMFCDGSYEKMTDITGETKYVCQGENCSRTKTVDQVENAEDIIDAS